MSEIREHNRDRSGKIQAERKPVRNFGTQSEERSTRSIGIMSEPVKTRNAGNEVQPQSSSTQTSGLLPPIQQIPYDLRQQDQIDIPQPLTQRIRYDTRTNGYHPSLDRRDNKYFSTTSIPTRQRDYLDYDPYQFSRRPEYNDDPRHQYIITRDDYQRSLTHRQRLPSPTNIHHTPPPPMEYRSTSPNARYRTPSPSDHHRYIQTLRSRSPSPPTQKYTYTSTNRHRAASPSSQHRSRQIERTPSPPSLKHPISSSSKNILRTPSPPVQYRSTSKSRRQMVSTETDTSLDGMTSRKHDSTQHEPPSTREYGITTTTTTNIDRPYSNNQNQTLPKRQDYIQTSPYEANYQFSRTDPSLSTQNNYRLRPMRNDSYSNNYEQIPLREDETTSPQYTRHIDHTKEYSMKPFTNGTSTIERRLTDQEQHARLTYTNSLDNDAYIRELPTGGSISIPSTTVLQPDTLPRSYVSNKSPLDNRRKQNEISLHRGIERTTSIRDGQLLNIGSEHIIYQTPDNELAIPFETRYVHEPNDDDFTTNNNNIRSSTLKRDDFKSKNNRILLLPVLNSSRTYVFEKQTLPSEQSMRQSKVNGNFYLATSPRLYSSQGSLHIDDSGYHPLRQTIDSTHLNGHGLRSQVA